MIPPGTSSFPSAADAQALLAVGFARVGGLALRVDRLEDALARLRAAARGGAFQPPPALQRVLDVEPGQVPALVEQLGWPRRPDGLHDRPARRGARPARRGA